MEDQFYSADESRSAGGEHGATTPAWNPIEQASPWPLASQIRQLLGEDCELDSAFFEESWTSGLHAAVESRQDRRVRPSIPNLQSCTFAELSGVGTFLFSQADAGSRDGSPFIPSAAPTASYTARWLREPLEESYTRAPDQASPADAAASGEDGKDQATHRPMKCQSAYELLKVNRYSTESQIKAAYRRMVGQWHPDRLERKSEEVREFATNQTAAINEAYHLLRDHSSMAFC
jgi:hypothetical protein